MGPPHCLGVTGWPSGFSKLYTRAQSWAEVRPLVVLPWLRGPGPFPDLQLDVDSHQGDVTFAVPSVGGALTSSSISGFIYFRAPRSRAH